MKALAVVLMLLVSVPAFAFKEAPSRGPAHGLTVGLTVGNAVGGGGFVLTPGGVIAY